MLPWDGAEVGAEDGSVFVKYEYPLTILLKISIRPLLVYFLSSCLVRSLNNLSLILLSSKSYDSFLFLVYES